MISGRSVSPTDHQKSEHFRKIGASGSPEIDKVRRLQIKLYGFARLGHMSNLAVLTIPTSRLELDTAFDVIP